MESFQRGTYVHKKDDNLTYFKIFISYEPLVHQGQKASFTS